MSIPTVTIDPKAPLKVEIRCGHQQPGSYRLTLWKDNEVAHEERGNFIDPHDDVYEFQPTDVDLNGVLVQLHVDVGIMPNTSQWAVMTTLSQNGRQLTTLTKSGEETAHREIGTDLWAKLTAN